MSALSRVCNDMNNYINTKGQIKNSTFIKEWHDLNNEFWLEVFRDALYLDDTTKYNLTPWTKTGIGQLAQHIFDHGKLHDNILNPTPKAMVGMHRAYTHFDKLTSVKSVLWKTMMQLREYYCLVHDIDLPNEDGSVGKLRSTRDTFGELFEWR